MKRPFKTLATFISAIILISNLSSVGAKDIEAKEKSIIAQYIPLMYYFSDEEELIEYLRSETGQILEEKWWILRERIREVEQILAEESRIAEEQRREEERRRQEEQRQNTIEELEEILFTSNLSSRSSYKFAFDVPNEPIEQSEIENIISKAQQDVQNLRPEEQTILSLNEDRITFKFNEDQTSFSLNEFKAANLVRNLEHSLGHDVSNRNHTLTRSETIEYLCLVYPKTSVILEANHIKVSYQKNELKIIFFLSGKVLDIFTLSTLNPEQHVN